MLEIREPIFLNNIMLILPVNVPSKRLNVERFAVFWALGPIWFIHLYIYILPFSQVENQSSLYLSLFHNFLLTTSLWDWSNRGKVIDPRSPSGLPWQSGNLCNHLLTVTVYEPIPHTVVVERNVGEKKNVRICFGSSLGRRVMYKQVSA